MTCIWLKVLIFSEAWAHIQVFFTNTILLPDLGPVFPQQINLPLI